jgi:hypothetical protein
MTKAKAQFRKFWDDIKPHSMEYVEFWIEMFKELGFDVTNVDGTHNISFTAKYTRPDGTIGNYYVFSRPTWCQGISIKGGVNPVKCLSETGLIKFCKINNVGKLK